jgi:membrane-bound serine protease (ClpP class)
VTKIVSVRRTTPQTGVEELVGDIGVVRQDLDPTGYVFVHGELWRAHAANGPVAAGRRVRVEHVGDDLVLGVLPIEDVSEVAGQAGERTPERSA